MKFSRSLGIAALYLALADAAAVLPPTKVKRSIVSDIESEVSKAWESINQIIPTTAAQGLIPGLDNMLPSVSDIRKKFDLTDEDIAKLPVQILNIPGYANWTGSNWNLRFHGAAYKTPMTNGSRLDKVTDVFIPGGLDNLNSTEQKDQARNLTARLFSLFVEDVGLSFDLRNSVDNSDIATVVFPKKTDSRGEYDMFVPLDSDRFKLSDMVQELNVYTNNTDSGTTTAYLVPPKGPLVISDIDDILRVTKIYVPKEGLLNSFARKFVPWMNMPDIYKKWKQVMPKTHFHYLTTTPEPATALYEDFIYKYYPHGSFDTRPWNFTTWDQLFQVRLVSLRRIIQTFPERHIVLVGDVSNRDIMRDYPKLQQEFPDTVKCILLRNVTSTDPSDKFPYDTSGFEKVPNNTYMFFNTPDDIAGLNFENGDCVNASVPQHVTFSYQNLPLGLGKSFAGQPFSILRSMRQVLFGGRPSRRSGA